MNKSKLAAYLFTFSGLLFLITSLSYLSTDNSNLTPVFASLGLSQITLAIVFYLKDKKACKKIEMK